MFSVSRINAGKTGDFYCQLGEQTGIGATRHLLHLSGINILVDSGVAFSKKGNVQIQSRAFGGNLEDLHIDVFIITHCHGDHVLDIPPLMKHHSESWIFVSKKALDAMIYMLYDSFKIATENALLAERLGEPVPEILFDEEDIEDFAQNPNIIQIEDGIDYNHPDLPGFTFSFAHSGHDVGAKMVRIVDPTGRVTALTGDAASHNQETCSGVMNPFGECNVLITEATNGAKRMPQTREEAWREVDEILRQIEDREGLALFCTFMKNRSANIVLGLVNLGYVPVVDGSARHLMRLELGNERVQQLLDEGKIIFIDENNGEVDNPKAAWQQREALLNGELGFHPIVAPSGTMEQGFANWWGHKLLPDRRNAVIFPGYIFPDSVSKQILEMERGRTITLNVYNRGRFVPTPTNVLADVYHLDGFSAHDYQQGLVDRVVSMKPKKLIVHHTDPRTFPVYAAAVDAQHASLGLKAPQIVHGAHLEEILL